MIASLPEVPEYCRHKNTLEHSGYVQQKAHILPSLTMDDVHDTYFVILQQKIYSSVLNKNPVFLFGTSAWTKFQCCLKSTVLVLGSSNFGFMSSFPFLISFDNEQGYCPAKS